MGKKEKPKFLDYLNAVKKADREREIAQHGKLISTRPLRIVKSKKVYDRKRDKRDCSNYNDGSLFFLCLRARFFKPVRGFRSPCIFSLPREH